MSLGPVQPQHVHQPPLRETMTPHQGFGQLPSTVCEDDPRAFLNLNVALLDEASQGVRYGGGGDAHGIRNPTSPNRRALHLHVVDRFQVLLYGGRRQVLPPSPAAGLGSARELRSKPLDEDQELVESNPRRKINLTHYALRIRPT